MSSEVSDRDNALFEAGIKLGALYHQFVGTPVNLDTVDELERTIESCISLQPYVKEVSVHIDLEIIRQNLNRFGYCELTGRMLNVHLVVVMGSTQVTARLEYDAELEYPLMRVEEISG